MFGVCGSWILRLILFRGDINYQLSAVWYGRKKLNTIFERSLLILILCLCQVVEYFKLSCFDKNFFSFLLCLRSPYPAPLHLLCQWQVLLKYYALMQIRYIFWQVVNIYYWYMRCYPEDISDKTNLYTAIQTNAAYQGLKHPVKKSDDGKYLPDFTYRYMTEDIPQGLVVIRGIAEIVGVETPNIDKVLLWSQEKMGKEYLVNSKIQGKDVEKSRAPQRYGFTTLESIL